MRTSAILLTTHSKNVQNVARPFQKLLIKVGMSKRFMGRILQDLSVSIVLLHSQEMSTEKDTIFLLIRRKDSYALSARKDSVQKVTYIGIRKPSTRRSANTIANFVVFPIVSIMI